VGVLARIAIFALATVACAWFALGIVEAHDLDRARTVISRPQAYSARTLRSTRTLLQSAGVLNPDAEVDILRGRLELAEGQRPAALQTLEEITRREPLNIEGWIWLAGATLRDPALGHAALGHIHELDPRSR
jgi:hypothetical protein